MSRAEEIRAKRARMQASRGAVEQESDTAPEQPSTVAPGRGSAAAPEQPSSRATEQTSNRAGEQSSKRAGERVPIFPDRKPRRPAVRVDDVKFSVLLSPREHAELVKWCADAASQLGRTRVPTTDAVKALVRLLLTERSLGEAALDELEDMNRTKFRGN